MEVKLYAPCKNEGCPHKFEAVGQPKGALPPSKPKGEPVVLLTCPRCGTTQEIPVKAFKVPTVEVATESASADSSSGGQGGGGDGGGEQNPPAGQ